MTFTLTQLLYILLLILFLIEIPILSLIRFLFIHRKDKNAVHQMRMVMLMFTTVMSIFILGLIILVLSGILRGFFPPNFIVGEFTFIVLLMFVVVWWAYFRIRGIIKVDKNSEIV